MSLLLVLVYLENFDRSHSVVAENKAKLKGHKELDEALKKRYDTIPRFSLVKKEEN